VRRKHVAAIIGALLLAGTLPVSAQKLAKSDAAAAKMMCPDEQTYTGPYQNLVFGFSIVIPPGLTGYWNSARCAPDEKYGCVCMGDHGRFIPLADNASIEAFVGWEMEPGWSAKDYEKEEVSYLRKREGVEQLKVIGSTWSHLRNLRGRRYVVESTDKGRAVVLEQIIALYRGVEYQLILRTTPERYQSDRREFEKVVSSWRLTRRVD
jgi:hypothetical protein